MKQKIIIKDEFAHDWISRAAGEALRQRILKLTEAGDEVKLDFKGVTIASTSFFDEGIAKLLDLGWTEDEINNRIICTEMHRRDREMLALILKRRGKQL